MEGEQVLVRLILGHDVFVIYLFIYLFVCIHEKEISPELSAAQQLDLLNIAAAGKGEIE